MKAGDKILAILPHSIAGRLIVSSMADGFSSLGFKVDIFDELFGSDFKSAFEKENYKYLTSYDFCAINLKRKNGIEAKTLNFFGDEIQDPHSGEGWNLFYDDLKDDSNLSYIWDKELFEKENNKNMMYLPHFVNTDIYKKLDVEKKYDVMFMGRLDTEFRLNNFKRILDEVPSLAFYSIERHYQDALNRLDDKHKPLLEKAYKGFIDNEPDMAEKINEAHIVINFNAQGVSSLNYRAIQTMACETLHISDERQDGTKYFKDNYISFKTLDEMFKKIYYYLRHREEAIIITKNIRQIIETNFSHRAGANAMIEFANSKDF